MWNSELQSQPIQTSRSAYLTLATAALFTFGLAGCGSGGSAAGPGSGASIPLAILGQPQSITVPLGQTATFTVIATGSGTLTYQWSRGGAAISGATSASYTTSPTQPSDNASEYTVEVSDPGSSLTSAQAELTLGPRSPKPYDIRFQEVDSPAVSDEGSAYGLVSNIELTDGSHSQYTNGAATGSPLEIGPSYYNCDTLVAYTDCAWGFFITDLPAGVSGLGVIYTGDAYESLNNDLTTIPPASISVVTSLDIQAPSDAFAMAITGSGFSSGFDMQQEIVTPAALQSTVTADGLKSRVITAIAVDGAGMVHVLSYGWQADTSTLYDVTSDIVAPADVAATAQTLAQQGYILTAFGGNVSTGYILIGTRVQGDTLPRPLVVDTQSGNTGAGIAGYAPVALLQYAGPGDQPAAVSFYTLVFEH